ncbi:MAG: hypothetical protein A2381_18750 [Bdellovibrionales bacterium RIFOXYB1_FULL_37_110]|nr:MAG: hypothetical protein A2181_05305 [Bdellovibrionales bacterium RIFOXYA1_FULL_38_20]OFZ51999.1 MAG: hypothetical protein A2417_05100 [Bdellovibrionales bacterium RIFOXYC1_FULL_37_79]OFZ60577.1 MAG: hypothetical protein A2381_18750 [Bdellovibrionales bacterium RIFOXYB1_FULL_37_110]OFZ61768.1 MAG: hypothetical protein A2577_19670 [Bdellovibrionales bacterium RIFOXYD1_FULL_36_51]OFZ72623.1 MAG: hypothetical protein A2451_14650 [Bdellovibrionales bacterium RIFOXYC2_FULL_39_8]
MIFKTCLLLLVLLVIGCEKKYSQNDCELLSMKSYKGIPSASADFSKYCLKYKIKYTHELCQLALNDLVKTSSLNLIQKKYGDTVIGCFTDNDLSNFAR